MASGSAPLNQEVQAFMEILMSAPLLEGYGSTETTAGVLYTMSSTPGQYSYLSVAFILVRTQLRSNFVAFPK